MNPDSAGSISSPMNMARDGGLVWITGLSGAGKSSVAAELARQLGHDGIRPILLDGDDLLSVLGVNGAFDLSARRSRAFVYGRFCRLLAEQGHVVICATIALFHAIHEWNRAHVHNYLEVFLDVPIAELRRRNTKGLYGPTGDENRVVGAGLAAEFPVRPDLVVHNFGDITAEAAAALIKHHVVPQGGFTSERVDPCA